MTFKQLHEILDNEDRKLSLFELEQVIYELKQDCINETYKLFCLYQEKEIKREDYINKNSFYNGESNAFQIALDLLEHLKKENNDERKTL